MPHPGSEGGRGRIGTILMAVAAVALIAWEGFQTWPTAAAHWSVAAVVAAAFGVAVAVGRGRQATGSGSWLSATRTSIRAWVRHPSRYGAGVLVWIGLLATVLGLDLAALLRGSDDFPTLSRLAGDLTRYRVGRALFFAVWIACGAYLAVVARRPADGGPDGGEDNGP